MRACACVRVIAHMCPYVCEFVYVAFVCVCVVHMCACAWRLLNSVLRCDLYMYISVMDPLVHATYSSLLPCDERKNNALLENRLL